MQNLTPDAQVTLLLCSYLSLAKGQAGDRLQPLKPQEWNNLGAALLRAKLRPGSLLQMDDSTMQSAVDLPAETADRMVRLLARGGQLAIELERLGSLGIWVLTRSDEAYPLRLKGRLGVASPPVLFGAGDWGILARGFLALVGSRDVDESGQAFAAQAGEACAREQLILVSGCARGVDRLGMAACLAAGGSAIGVVSDSLERVVREPDYRRAVSEGRLALISAVHPRAPFSVANAMARNKYIYCLARYGLVVSASLDKGGTRTGALEVLQERWVPLFVRAADSAPEGNRDLVRLGALSFPEQVPEGLSHWLEAGAQSWSESEALPKRRSLRAVSSVKAEGGARKPVQEAPASEEDDLFPIVWPHIAERLSRWPRLEELAVHLQVDSAQMHTWLKRAVDMGWLVRSQETGQYRLPDAGPHKAQMRLDV